MREREREELSPGILSNPGDCNYHSGGISFAVGTLILQDKSNQQQSILLCESVSQMWVNDEIYGDGRLFRSGGGCVWVSVAMSEPGPSFVSVLDGTLSSVSLVSSFSLC